MADERGKFAEIFAEHIAKLGAVNLSEVVDTYTIGGGKKPFSNLRDEIVRVQQLASAAQRMSVDELLLPILSDLSAATAGVSQLIENVRNFNPNQNPDAEPHLRQAFPAKCKAFCEAVATLFSIAAARNIANQEELTQGFSMTVQQHKDELQKNAEESKKALEALRKTTSEAAASREANHFEKQSHGYAIASRWWLAFTIGTMCIIAAGLIYLYYHTPPATESKVVVAQQIAAKVILLSLAFGLVVFFGRNYSTNRHNFIINKHRATALLTFQAFIAGTADAETKDAVLIAAARSVFSPQTTGYLRKDAVQLGGPLLEMLRSASGK